MKLGELRVEQGGFAMMTPEGLRGVTLRCTESGYVMVEEVTGGGLSIKPLVIQHSISAHSSDAAHALELARVAAARAPRHTGP